MRCKNCKYWEKHEDLAFACHVDGQDIGLCRAASIDRFIKGKHRFDSEYDGEVILAVATCNSEGIYGELVTDAEFGCISFEPIP